MVGVPTLLGKMNASMERLITQHVCSLWDCSSISRSVLVHEIQLLGKCGKAAPDFETTAVSSQHSHLVADYTYSTFSQILQQTASLALQCNGPLKRPERRRTS